MSDERIATEEATQIAPKLSWPAWIVFGFGAAALGGAVATDTLAVIGRQVGMPILGSIELVQAFVVVSGAAAFIAATLSAEHIAVRVLTERLPERSQAAWRRFGDLCGGLFFAALAVGSVWMFWDLRNGAERTEILGIQLFWLRALWIACAFVCTALFFYRTVRRTRP